MVNDKDMWNVISKKGKMCNNNSWLKCVWHLNHNSILGSADTWYKTTSLKPFGASRGAERTI